MNRYQRNYRRFVKKGETAVKTRRNRLSSYEIEEVLPSGSKRSSFNADKFMTNKCCYISPARKNVEKLTEIDDYFIDLVKQYNFNAIFPDATKKEFKNEYCTANAVVDNSSQYQKQTSTPPHEETFDSSRWRDLGNTFEFLNIEKEDLFISDSTKNIRISDVPRVKVIAEKFSKFKKNNVEVRRLDEKIVCLEYDVFISDRPYEKPFQTMRAYFSVKPIMNYKENVIMLPKSIKNKFKMSDEDLSKLNDKEIEIIDSKIAENKPYLDDLKKVLKRRQAIYAKKKKSTLDLMSLYEMAKRDSPTFDEDFSNTNLLSKAELDEIKELITKKCASSIHGISRRTVKSDKSDDINVISQTIFTELIRDA